MNLLENMLIEAFRDEYGQAIIDLILGIQVGEFGVPVTIDDQPDLMDIAKFYKGFWLARAEDRVVGTIGLIQFGEHLGALRKMFVDADFRGKNKGIAVALLKRLIEESKVMGIQALYLGTVDAFKAAHRFYEREGFKEIEAAELPADFPRMPIDTKFYQLNL